MLHFNLVPHHQTSSNPGISYTCISSLKAHWRAGITAALQPGVAEMRLCSLEFISLMDGAPHNRGRWRFCSGLPSVHSISVGTDSSLHCIIGCNSKPPSRRAAGFEGEAQPERGVGLALRPAAPVRAHSAGHPGSAARVLWVLSVCVWWLAQPQELCLLGSCKCDLFSV